MPEVLHSLQERLDGLRAEVEVAVAAARSERVGLVDEEDAVERTPDCAVGLDRGLADVLADERSAVDPACSALLEQPHRSVHLGQQAGDCGLPGAWIPEEDEVLARRNLREVVVLAARLHLEERDETVHLLLDGVEADEPVQFRLQFGERSRLGPRPEPVGEELLDLRPAVRRSWSPRFLIVPRSSSSGFTRAR